MVKDPTEIQGLQSWLKETDFEESTIVYVETTAPTTCYTELDVGDIAIEADAIVGTAEAIDTSADDEMCGQAETYPSAFVRVTAANRPGETQFTVVDGWGESSEVAADGRFANPENLPGHVRPEGDPQKLEAFTCDDEDFQRHWAPEGNVALGEAHNDENLTFAMRVHATQALAAGE